MKADIISPVRVLVIALLFFSSNINAQLIINEVSQGPSGSKEWVELLVIGNPSCDSTCVDLRGWIIDDNNGTYASGSGTGIAGGHMRFSNDAQWACVGYGALILIYNESDPDPALPSDDLTDSNGDCVYVLPGSSSLFERDEIIPSISGTSSYVGSNYVSGGSWSTVQMNNSTDSYQTLNPRNLNQAFFAVSWGNNNSNNIIYINGTAGGSTIFMGNTVSNNPFDQNNWVQSTNGIDQTPGLPNNSANATWIVALNNNCNGFVPPSLEVLTNDTNVCAGSPVELTAITNTSSTPIFNWNTGQSGSPVTVTTDQDSAFIVTANVSGCILTDSVRITVGGQTVFDLGNDTAICEGTIVNLSAPQSGFYLWSTNETDSVISIQAQSTQTIVLEITNGNCIGIDSIEIEVQSPPVLTVSDDTLICEGNSVLLSASGASDYSWSNGENTPQIQVSPLSSTSYSVTASTGACSVTEAVRVDLFANDLSANVDITDVTCSGLVDGTIELENVQGNPSQIELLDNQGNVIESGLDSVFENLEAGTYTILLSNSDACKLDIEGLEINEDTVDFTYNIIEPDCENQNGSIEIITEQENTVSLNGSQFEMNYLFEDLEEGVYSIEILDSSGCSASDNIVLEAPTPIELNILRDSLSGMFTETQAIEVVLNGGESPFTWGWTSGFDLSCYECANPILTFENSGWLYLDINDVNQCSASDSVFIGVEESLNFGIPNAFTPNSNGVNDTYFVVANGELRNFKMKIFNRWGQKVFETNDNSIGWDGTYKGELQNAGTYVYSIRFDEFSNGQWRQRIEEGSLTLLR